MIISASALNPGNLLEEVKKRWRMPLDEQIGLGLQKGLLSSEMVTGMRTVFFSMFGGPENLDCWLTGMADALASPQPAPAIPAQVPDHFRAWMSRPSEVIDHLLEQMHGLWTWKYLIRGTQEGGYEVVDVTTGHVVETVVGRPEVVQWLAAKYGPNIEVQGGLAEH
jgi:hypothetical protein